MPRFVILRHELPSGQDRGTHFDLMLEMGGILRTWALPELPEVGKVIDAEALPDHRLAYLEYEGPVSGNRGVVSRVEEGEYHALTESPVLIRFQIVGMKMAGTLELSRSELAAVCWSVTFRPE